MYNNNLHHNIMSTAFNWNYGSTLVDREMQQEFQDEPRLPRRIETYRAEKQNETLSWNRNATNNWRPDDRLRAPNESQTFSNDHIDWNREDTIPFTASKQMVNSSPESNETLSWNRNETNNWKPDNRLRAPNESQAFSIDHIDWNREDTIPFTSSKQTVNSSPESNETLSWNRNETNNWKPIKNVGLREPNETFSMDHIDWNRKEKEIPLTTAKQVVNPFDNNDIKFNLESDVLQSKLDRKWRKGLSGGGKRTFKRYLSMGLTGEEARRKLEDAKIEKQAKYGYIEKVIRLPNPNEPGGINDKLRKGLNNACVKRYVKFLDKGFTPIKARERTIEIREMNSRRHKRNRELFKARQQRMDENPSLASGQRGSLLVDPLSKGLSGAGVKWYLRFLKQGLTPIEARKRVDDRRHNDNKQFANNSKKPEKEEDKTIQVLVLPKNHPNETLTSQDLNILKKAIIMEVSRGWQSKLQIGGLTIKSSTITVDCKDYASVKWLKEKISCLKGWNGCELMATNENE